MISGPVLVAAVFRLIAALSSTRMTRCHGKVQDQDGFCRGLPDPNVDPQARFKSVTTPSLASTNLCGSIPNTSFQVPAAAHTSSYCNRCGSMKIRSGCENPKGGTPRLGL